TRSLKRATAEQKSKWLNSGLPYTRVDSNFSRSLVRWMLDQKMSVRGRLDAEGSQLAGVLRFTLPEVEREYTAMADTNTALLDFLNVPEPKALEFLLRETERYAGQAALQDELFDKMGLDLEIKLHDPKRSRLYNALQVSSPYYQSGITKTFDRTALLNQKIPDPMPLTSGQRKEVAAVSRMKLLLLQRETDPVTHMDENSIRYYALERGVSIAFFTMVPERQLPLESYVGYTLFKNGYPAAYGGAWLLGNRALIGINIFEWFRGGESAFLFGQLLRTYRQVFDLDYFEVEPYQYGLDNPEGITSGAFWFYFHFGFRPLDPALRKLAEKEARKLTSKKGYRSAPEILEQFTESNIALKLGRKKPVAMWQLRNRVSTMIHLDYGNDRMKAERHAVSGFLKYSGMPMPRDPLQRRTLTDLAWIAMAYQWSDPEGYQIMKRMVESRSADVYRYQESTRTWMDRYF
ncbi:MAG TPA: hypothetical protein VFX48_09450, partial [Saprospiraceae bacterium]|nr:hypothetical protein [Saprospiraceae bacterium]